MTQEIWQPIPGYPDYEVSNMGQVRSLKGNRISPKKGTPDKDGYLRTNLTVDGKKFQRAVHKLVMLAFVGPCPEGREICHGPDSDKTNNRLDNLRYDTHFANMQEFAGRINREFAQKEVEELIERYEAGNVSVHQLAEDYKVNECVIYYHLKKRIRIRIRNKPVALSLHQKRARAKVIREEAKAGIPSVELAKKYGLNRSYIYRVLIGDRHLHAGGPIQGVDY